MPLGAVLPGPHVELKPPLAVDPRALGGIAQLVGGIAEQHDADELHVVARADRDAKAQILLAGLRGFQFGVADQRAEKCTVNHCGRSHFQSGWQPGP